MQSVEAEGESIDAAIGNALRMLGVTRERVEIEILATSSRGLFGLGGRKARVRATLRAPLTDTPPSIDGTERAASVLKAIVAHLGVEVHIAMRPQTDHVLIELGGDTSGVLIGRRGQMLDALEYILNRIMLQDDDGATRFMLDSQDYRARHQSALEGLARRTAQDAKEKHRSAMLHPMSPRDRRIVHLVLNDVPGLTTKSAGKGYLRRVVIIPEGAKRSPQASRRTPR